MVVLAPDAERVVSDYLRTHPLITAFGARVRGSMPDTTELPWVRVLQIDARQGVNDTTFHLVDYYLQFDCYAGRTGGHPEASQLARTVSSVLARIGESSHSGAVVTGSRISGGFRSPDPTLTDEDGNDRERVIVSGVFWLHP
jgi:hypothetical protein